MAKTNVKYAHTAYGVNHQEKTVTCVLDYDINLDSVPGIEFISEISEFNDFINRLVYNYGVKYIENDSTTYGILRFRVTDIAFCSSDDTFDEVIGKRLSNTRAQKLAFRNTKYFYNDIAKIVMHYVDENNNLAYNCFECEHDCHNHEFEVTA